MTQEKNYKETLNLPKATIPMKAALAQREPELLEVWKKESLYEAIRQKSSGKEKFILHDGPPYANGQIHIGHALNKILKDIIVKYRTMCDYDAFYLPGWDCHGLPIEHQCLKEMGKRKEEVERVDFRKKARRYAEKFVSMQREEFKRLAVFGEWEKPYLTMSYGYQAAIAESFLDLFEAEFIYEGLKPVPWCFDCETALADAELEYEDKKSQSVYVKFKAEKAIGGKPVYFLVWTTTPWTLPANVGVAVHPELHYSEIHFQGEVWIVAEARAEHVKSFATDMGEPVSSGRKKGADLVGMEYFHPLVERRGRVIAADYVSAADGTGIVHIAPGHGEEDYHFGYLQNQMEIISPVDVKGRFTEEFSPCEGVHVFKANEKIVEMLKERNLLVAAETHQHSYPHCWRCKKPIIFRATKQWFMKIDHRDLRRKMLEAIGKDIQFIPEWGKKRISAMVENRPEWCLSRQRYWGVPIPIIYCANCPDTFFVAESRKKIVEVFETEGADAWFSHNVADFLERGFKCPQCKKSEFAKVEDIIDVWFDSGVSHRAVLKGSEELAYPADLYLEGSDQHRGWFQSALTTAMALDGRAPYKGVLTHGFVVDGAGKKMSKSSGNVVAPQDVVKQFGVDILRLWVSSCDYEYDVRLSQEILKQLADAYRKIRNTFRYILANLYDFESESHAVAIEKLHPLDRWAVLKTDEQMRLVNDAYRGYDFHRVYRLLYDFCSLDLSSYYFDILKDTLYTAAKDSFLRRSAQSAMFYVLTRLVKFAAPILSFTADEVWRAYSIEKDVPSVHCSSFPSLGRAPADEDSVYRDWEHMREIRDVVTMALEKKREAKEIGSSLDAKVCMKVHHRESAQIIGRNVEHLSRIFIVSGVVLTDEEVIGGGEVFFQSGVFGEKIKVTMAVEKADGDKCVRCWIYSPVVGTHTEHPGLCQKCLEAIEAVTA